MRTLLLMIAVLLLAGCSSTTRERQRPVDEDAYDELDDHHDPEESAGTVIRFHGSEAGTQLAKAQALIRGGDFAGGIAIYRAVHASETVDDELRADALLGWAESEGNLLNPRRDFDRAMQLLRDFEAEFPESPRLGEVRSTRESLQEMKKRQGAGTDTTSENSAIGG